MTVKVNLNSYMKVKLNDLGKDIYYHQYDELNKMVTSYKIKPKMPKVDEEGYTSFQIWQFMNLYGEYMKMGFEGVLESLDVIIENCWEEGEDDG